MKSSAERQRRKALGGSRWYSPQHNPDLRIPQRCSLEKVREGSAPVLGLPKLPPFHSLALRVPHLLHADPGCRREISGPRDP